MRDEREGRVMDNDIRTEVRARYAEAARAGRPSSACCADEGGCAPTDGRFGGTLYDAAQTRDLPAELLEASLGCGNPTAVADIQEGQVVLDLGSGAGLDVLLSARRVGPTGKVYGLDMTDEMLELAERNASEAGVDNVEFLRGYIEQIPLPDASVDVLISNCVINLSADKDAVFSEVARVLRPGGRLGISDVVADDDLTSEERARRGSYVGCIAGALSRSEYESSLSARGFGSIEIVPTHEVAPGMHGAIIRATRS